MAILHELFGAVLPPRFDTESDRSNALARLILGEVLVGSGEFEFRGQPMTLLEPLDLNSLPPAPELNIVEPKRKSSPGYTCLRNVDYIPGLTLLDFQAFNAIRATEINWASTNAYVGEQVYRNATSVWEIAQANLDSPILNSYDNDVPGYGVEDLRELREIYPELAKLSDGALYWLFDCYQFDCCGIRDWNPNREDSFLFYLLGLVATTEQANGEDARKVGEFVGHKSLYVNLPEALHAEQVWFNYDTAIHNNLAWRIYRAMEFLRQSQIGSGNQGDPITTFTGLTQVTF